MYNKPQKIGIHYDFRAHRIVLYWLHHICVNFLQGLQVPLNYGFKWGLGNRDVPQEPTIFMQRIARTLNNQIQAMAIAVPVLVTLVLYPQAQSAVTQMGAWVFLFGRVTFSIIYLIGIPYLRSVVWGVGVIG